MGADAIADRCVVAQRIEVVGVVGRGAVRQCGVVGQALAEVGLEDGDAVVQEVVMQLLPPRTRVGIGEIDQSTVSSIGGRRAAQVSDVPGRCLDQIAALLGFGIPRRGGIEVGQLPDRQSNAPLGEIVHELFAVAEPVGVPQEISVEPIHDQPVRIEVQHIAGHLMGAHLVGDVNHLGVGVVATPTHPVAERPHRRARPPTGERGVALQPLGNAVPRDQVQVDGGVIVGQRHHAGHAVTDVAGDAGAGVEEAQVAAAGVPDRNRLVRHSGARAERVFDPQVEALPVLDQAAELLAETGDVFVDGQLQAERLGVVDRAGSAERSADRRPGEDAQRCAAVRGRIGKP